MKPTKNNRNSYKDFQQRFKLFANKRSAIVENTLSNIFTMRLIGNKAHGDMAEIGIAEFIHQFMYDFESEHIGKDLFRSKQHEEDIIIINELTKERIPVSLKAYGDGPLQLSTDKNAHMFPTLKKYGEDIRQQQKIQEIFETEAFQSLDSVNVMPLIYREKSKECNIMVFDFDKMKKQTSRILFVNKNQQYDENSKCIIDHKGRKHPVYLFLDKSGKYICEVRYGDASANALQRGFWTHTQDAVNYFDSLTNGWVSYEHNLILVQLFRLALNSSKSGHEKANTILQEDIDYLKKSR